MQGTMECYISQEAKAEKASLVSSDKEMDDEFQIILQYEDVDSESDRKPRLLDLWMHSRIGKFIYHWEGEGFWGLVILVALVYYFVG